MAYWGKEIVYTRGGSRDLKLDLYRPEGSQHFHAVVLLLHGGAWRVGDRSTMDVYGRELARQGITAVAPEYRLLGEAAWPAQIADVKAAVRWTRAHAEALDILPGRIAVQGFSAGAHLALMAGGTPNSRLFGEMPEQEAVSDQVNAVIAFFPPIAFTVDDRVPGTTPASVLLGESATEKDAIEASPLSYVSEAYPPTFLLHGTADQVVPCTNSIQLFGRLQEKGVFVELHLYPGHTHEFARLPSMLAPVQAEIALFLKRAVVNPEVYVRENRELNMFAKT